ncbi:hypothetical protein EHV15_12655 [Paenibacillus oralis]|uniref:Uncharacterized protein n=1 Tax=Paenibacillus oralis TaxID=2490856 RepID=A0A3P3U1C4_9BACL|nr:hypothetical protein [Paenibacillus oralis]RRJ63686.1 hypothetical protein EHV15_12655 [Paenibacillus oralis]
MIGHCNLHGALIPKFRDHLMQFAYYPVIRHGLSDLNVGLKTFTLEEAEAMVNDFTKWRFPIVCLAGSKSSIPFFDYHIALGFGENEREVTISELLVREPVHENAVKGILLAYYTLVNDKTGIERMRVPFVLPGLRGEGLKIEIDPPKM